MICIGTELPVVPEPGATRHMDGLLSLAVQHCTTISLSLHIGSYIILYYTAAYDGI